MVAVPAATPVTNPVAFTVAMAGLLDTYGFVAFAVAVPVNWVVEPIHTVCTPVMVGNGFTVTTTASVALQPVAVIVTLNV